MKCYKTYFPKKKLFVVKEGPQCIFLVNFWCVLHQMDKTYLIFCLMDIKHIYLNFMSLYYILLFMFGSKAK